MPTMKGSTAIAANTTSSTILTGQDYEFLPYNAEISCWLAQSATGLQVDVKATAEDLASGVVPNIAAAAGRVQTDTDGVVEREPLAAGTRLRLVAANTTAGALTLNWLISIEQI